MLCEGWPGRKRLDKAKPAACSLHTVGAGHMVAFSHVTDLEPHVSMVSSVSTVPPLLTQTLVTAQQGQLTPHPNFMKTPIIEKSV